MVQYRDIIQKQQGKFDKKQDRRDFVKAVITDALGNTTGAGSIWADRNTRRVWIQENGSASLSQVPCYRITPVIGLGVIVGFEPYSTIREVLATDREFYGPTNSTGTSYESPSNEDMLPGGRLQLWLDSRLLQPLAVYPADALNVNVVEGSYPYNGVRKSFAGQINYDLSAYQPAGPNEHCLVGLYLDASNNLQVVAGATVSTAVTAPEPSWPSGSFLLSVVDLDDTQTSLSLADDIQDWRMAWSDEKTAPIDAQYLTLATNSVLTQERVFTPSLPLSGSDGGAGNPYTLSVNAATESASGVAELATQAETNTGTDDARIVTPLKLANWTGAKAGWPIAGKAMINNVEYDTVQLAIDGMAAGDIIKVGQGTDAGGIVPDTAGSIVGLSPVETIITASANDSATVNNSAGADNLTLENLTVSNTGAGTSVACIQSNKDGLRLDNLDIKKVSGTPTNSTGVSVYGGSGAGTYLLNCRISVTTGTNKYGVYMSTGAANCIIEGGEINAATADISLTHASNVLELRGVKLIGGVINATTGILRGWAVDDKGRDCGKIVKNTSGATVNRGDIGYLDSAGEFKTTTTANNFTGAECVVTAGGPNNGWIFARRTGNATVNYTGSAPNAGDYLVTSTSAGLAQAQTTTRPEIFAVCLATGSGGVVEVQLLTQRLTKYVAPLTELIRIASHSGTNFTGTINGAPSGSTLIYTITGGTNEDSIKPSSASELGKIVLHNTTRGDSALIDSVDLGTNTITLTAAVPGAWANGDVITTRSQTSTGTASSAYFYDIDLSSADNTVIDPLAVGFSGQLYFIESAVGPYAIIHPFEATASSKNQSIAGQNGEEQDYMEMYLIQRRFCLLCGASGSATATVIFHVNKIVVAAP